MKYSVIGNGFIARKHIEAINTVGGEVVMVCDIDEGKRTQDYPFTTDYKEAIDKSEAVAICVPNHLHAEIALEAARRGKKILCEKPVTFKLEELELMKGVPNLFGVFQLRYLPEINQMRHEARNCQEATLRVEMKRSSKYYESWKGNPEKSGGLLINIGTHYFDLLGHLFGYKGFESKVFLNTETEACGQLIYPDKNIYWSFALTDEKENYERSLTIGKKVFDLVQKENLHIKVYENFMWGQGITVKEEEKILRMIKSIC